MLVGAVWAGIAGFLKVTRGVSEVISTIMLNAIATAVVAYLLNPARLAVSVAGSNNIGTAPITEGGQIPGFDYPGSSSKIFGLILLAALVGFLYWFMLNRTRFGFDLKATGLSESAAVASGVNVKKMIVATMLLSGAAAGLVGMPQLLGSSYSYALDFPSGLGFTGIAIALLGRNHPVGMAFAALLWGVLDQTSNVLDISGVPKEIVVIMQGVIVLSVVIAYELVRRSRLRLEQREVGKALGAPHLAVDPRFATGKARSDNRDILNEAIEAITRGKTSAEWIDKLNAEGVPSGPIYKMNEVFEDPQPKEWLPKRTERNRGRAGRIKQS